MLPRCPEEFIRPMSVPQFQPGLCEPSSSNRSGTRGGGLTACIHTLLSYAWFVGQNSALKTRSRDRVSQPIDPSSHEHPTSGATRKGVNLVSISHVSIIVTARPESQCALTHTIGVIKLPKTSNGRITPGASFNRPSNSLPTLTQICHPSLRILPKLSARIATLLKLRLVRCQSPIWGPKYEINLLNHSPYEPVDLHRCGYLSGNGNVVQKISLIQLLELRGRGDR